VWERMTKLDRAILGWGWFLITLLCGR
jgi:hypothetical protein